MPVGEPRLPAVDVDAPVLDVVVPVHNEEVALAASVARLHRQLQRLPYSFRITIADNASVDGTALVAHRLSWAPVLDEDRTVVGVLSSADLLRHRVEGRDIEATPAWRLCTYKPLQVAADTPSRDVARLMTERRIHHVVVEGPRGIAGVVSAFDFVKAIAGS